MTPGLESSDADQVGTRRTPSYWAGVQLKWLRRLRGRGSRLRLTFDPQPIAVLRYERGAHAKGPRSRMRHWRGIRQG
jgi:hypothetical protein